MKKGGRMREKEIQIYAVRALKIAVGSCISIILAEWFHLEFASSAGIIALLTIVETKRKTLKLSLVRMISFLVTVCYAWIIFTHVNKTWLTYGVFILLLTGTCYIMDWKETISVNAVIGTHFWSTGIMGKPEILNEFYLVLIGITVAIILNMVHGNQSQKKRIVEDMRYIEQRLQEILGEISQYLHSKNVRGIAWEDIKKLEAHLERALERAYHYKENNFAAHPEYYIQYIEMRLNQCNILYNLHAEMRKIRELPEQAIPIANYIDYMKNYIMEMNMPEKQLERLHQMEEEFRRSPLPVSRNEFEARAMLYHIMMDLEDFLLYKKRFIDSINEEQFRIYWKKKGDP